MYQVKINEVIVNFTEVVIADGEQAIDENGNLLEVQQIEITEVEQDGFMISVEQGAVDENGDPVMIPIINNSGKDEIVSVFKTEQQINDEKQALIDAKTVEIQAEVDTYKQAQEYQRKHGGPGPVAKEEIMAIVNEYNSKFEVVFKEE